MSHNDRQKNGQHRPNSNLDQLELPPAREGKQRLARLRTAWRESWEEGGFLYQRWEELFQARHAGWHEITVFLQTVPCLMRHGPVETAGLVSVSAGAGQQWGGYGQTLVGSRLERPVTAASAGGRRYLLISAIT
ncbi:hypothetical protein ACIRD9_40535 [Streptomyces violaceus]|uniref:hypothetical protein n=1 Tax=Streptomyces violaceus TaxID=1936 RepID=UPI00381D05FF